MMMKKSQSDREEVEEEQIRVCLRIRPMRH